MSLSFIRENVEECISVSVLQPRDNHSKKSCPKKFIAEKNSTDCLRLLQTSSDFLENIIGIPCTSSRNYRTFSDFHGPPQKCLKIPRFSSTSDFLGFLGLPQLSREFLGLTSWTFQRILRTSLVFLQTSSRIPRNSSKMPRTSMRMPWTTTNILRQRLEFFGLYLASSKNSP